MCEGDGPRRHFRIQCAFLHNSNTHCSTHCLSERTIAFVQGEPTCTEAHTHASLSAVERQLPLLIDERYII